MIQMAQMVAPGILGVASRPVYALFPGTLFRLKEDERGKVWSAQRFNGDIIGWPILEDSSVLLKNGLVNPEAEALVLDPDHLGLCQIVLADVDEVELSE